MIPGSSGWLCWLAVVSRPVGLRRRVKQVFHIRAAGQDELVDIVAGHGIAKPRLFHDCVFESERQIRIDGLQRALEVMVFTQLCCVRIWLPPPIDPASRCWIARREPSGPSNTRGHSRHGAVPTRR